MKTKITKTQSDFVTIAYFNKHSYQTSKNIVIRIYVKIEQKRRKVIFFKREYLFPRKKALPGVLVS